MLTFCFAMTYYRAWLKMIEAHIRQRLRSRLVRGYALREEPFTDPYGRLGGPTGASGPR